ncbi:MAG: hypothetical protein AAFV53_16200, partial [Myxococcota bacterium]
MKSAQSLALLVIMGCSVAPAAPSPVEPLLEDDAEVDVQAPAVSLEPSIDPPDNVFAPLMDDHIFSRLILILILILYRRSVGERIADVVVHQGS